MVQGESMPGPGLDPAFPDSEQSQGKEQKSRIGRGLPGEQCSAFRARWLETELVSSTQWMEIWARAHDFALPSGDLHAT